jgi:hypothetical protein
MTGNLLLVPSAVFIHAGLQTRRQTCPDQPDPIINLSTGCSQVFPEKSINGFFLIWRGLLLK